MEQQLFDDPGCSRSIERYKARYNYLSKLLSSFDQSAWDHQQLPFTRDYAVSTCKILLTYINLHNRSYNNENESNKHP